MTKNPLSLATDIKAKLFDLDAMTLNEYALRFGGLIVPDARLAAYKAEYRAALLVKLAKATADDAVMDAKLKAFYAKAGR